MWQRQAQKEAKRPRNCCEIGRTVCQIFQFIPCAAHSLNLVGVNAAERVLQAKLSLGQIQTIFMFFHASTQRWQVLNSKLNYHLKGHCTTPWSSRAESVQALATQ